MNDASGFDEFGASGPPSLTDGRDRIFLRDHVRKVEIGAYHEEYGASQRVRFNVALDVQRPATVVVVDDDDDMKNIISYDLIVAAIDTIVGGPRIKLLETFAERLAAALLQEPRVVAAHIRLEKLDRVSGALGVEIVRQRRRSP